MLPPESPLVSGKLSLAHVRRGRQNVPIAVGISPDALSCSVEESDSSTAKQLSAGWTLANYRKMAASTNGSQGTGPAHVLHLQWEKPPGEGVMAHGLVACCRVQIEGPTSEGYAKTRARQPHQRPFCPSLISTILQLAVCSLSCLRVSRFTNERGNSNNDFKGAQQSAPRRKQEVERKPASQNRGHVEDPSNESFIQDRVEKATVRGKKIETNQPTALL